MQDSLQYHRQQFVLKFPQYQSWKTIVPFLAEINPDHPFITWLAEQKDDNFGYLVIG